jgi:hypothetical protein
VSNSRSFLSRLWAACWFICNRQVICTRCQTDVHDAAVTCAAAEARDLSDPIEAPKVEGVMKGFLRQSARLLDTIHSICAVALAFVWCMQGAAVP